MDKRVLRERMRRKQRQLRRRKIMRLVGYVLGVVLVVTFLVRGVILPIARGIGGRDADKPVEIQAETETVEADPDAAIRKPLKGKDDLTKASDLTAGWHEDENGKWYQNFDGTYFAGGFQEIDGVTYSFDDNGYIQTGWVSNGFDDLYFNEDGSYNPDKHKTRIALTFDDGPGEYTDQLLDCLEENNAHATFFMLGQNVESWESTVQRMVDIGCEIGSHSYDHPDLLSLSEEEIQNQFQKTDDALKQACGQPASVARAPYGSANQTVYDIVQKPFFMWSLDTQDWSLLNVDADYNAVMNGDLTDGSIILMHDIHEPSVQAAVKLIPDLLEKGYKLMTVSELAEAKGVDLQYASYTDFWDSSMESGLVAGYEGSTSSEDENSDGSGGDVSDGDSGEETFDDGSGDYSDGSDDSGYSDGSGDYSDGSDDSSYSDDSGDEYCEEDSGEY